MHAGREYRVFVVGFVPGFAYMAPVDPRIAAPRRTSPRLKVPAGSVAVAAGQTGVYPAETPGGWHLIGRTPVKPYDPARAKPFLFHPGDRVRFRRIDGATSIAETTRVEIGSNEPALTVIKPGHADDRAGSRPAGYQGLGVPVAGPMDWYSHRRANQLLGNDPMAAALEITLIGPELVADGDVVAVVTGAEFETLDGCDADASSNSRSRCGPAAGFASARAKAGRARRSPSRAALVVPLDARQPRDAPRQRDGRRRRPCAACRRSPAGRRTARVATAVGRGVRWRCRDGGATVRIVEAAHRDRFTDEAWAALTSERFVITPHSNRMGYRLDGPRARAQSRRGSLLGGDADRRAPGSGVGPADPA